MTKSEKVTFLGSQGQELAGRLDLPDGNVKAYALFAHCFTCSKDYVASASIARELAAQGIATLRFDFTGLGNSQGDFANTNFSSNVDDLVAAAKFLADKYEAPKLIMGHSFGGAAILAAADRIPSAAAVATVAAPADPEHVGHLFQNSRDEITTTGQAKVDLFGRLFTIKKQFLDDIEGQKMAHHIKNLGKALLVFHAPGDKIVEIDNAARIYKMAKHPKSFISLDNSDHLITQKKDAQYIAEVLNAWISRYIVLDASAASEAA